MPRVTRSAFTLVEVMVVVAMLALIILALMTVLNSTQTAFRAGITQSGVSESGRAVMDLIKGDLETMTPSLGTSNGAVNFYANTNWGYIPLYQALPASSQLRTNVVENFFILNSGNVNGSPNWIGTGYAVATNSPGGGLYSLYRFSTNHPVMTTDPEFIFTNDFYQFLSAPTNGSHLIDGVVDLRVRAFDTNGMWMASGYTNAQNVSFSTIILGEGGFYMFSNAVPASVEVELGVLEDHTLQSAESIADAAAQMNYLSNHVGQVHIFRQRAWIRNVDPAAYK